MPLPQKIVFVFGNERFDPAKFLRWKSYVVLQPDR